MKTQTLTKILEPAFSAYTTKMLPGINLGVRLSLRSLEGVLTSVDDNVSLAWRDRFNDVAATLMRQSGMDVVFAYVFGNEVHLLISQGCNFLGRDLARTISSLTSMAALAFSQGKDDQGIFDCRVAALPNWDFVQDYFRHQRRNCRDRAIANLCEHSMQLTFPAKSRTQVRQEVGTMKHARRLEYCEAYGTLHGAGSHMDTWYEYGHMLRFMEHDILADTPVAISAATADVDEFDLAIESAMYDE